MLGNFSCFCCHLLTFFKTNFIKKNLSGTLSECQTVWIQIRTYVGSRSGPMLCLSWSGSKLFAKVISWQQKLVLASKELNCQYWLLRTKSTAQTKYLSCLPISSQSRIAIFSNPFCAHHNFCHLLSHQLILLGSLYYKQYGSRSDCSPWSSLIRVHSVCFHDKILCELLKYTLIYAADVKSRQHFQDKSILAYFRFNF